MTILVTNACSRSDPPKVRSEAEAADSAMLEHDLALAMRDTSTVFDTAGMGPASPPVTTVDSIAAAARGDLPQSAATPRAVATTPASAPVVPPVPAPSAAAPRRSTPVPASKKPAPAAVATGISRCRSEAPADQRACLNASLARTDAGLNRVYQALIAQMRERLGTHPGAVDPRQVRQLRAGQRQWIVYRDVECQRRNWGREGKLWAPVRARCLAEYSDRREAELSRSLQQWRSR